MSDKVLFKNEKLTVINDDVLTTDLIDENSIDLVVTSPPYNLGKEYTSYDDQKDYSEYLEFIGKSLERIYLWLKFSGRLCLNIPLDTFKYNHKCIYADIITIAQNIGFKYYATIIWNKGAVNNRFYWGSYRSASAPNILLPVEAIVVLYKGEYKRDSTGRVSTISQQEFIDWTYGLWILSRFNDRTLHPCAFPLDLPIRCIKLFSFVGDVVLDPFMGIGTTLIASYLLDRVGIGIDIDPNYCRVAIERIKKECKLDSHTLLGVNEILI